MHSPLHITDTHYRFTHSTKKPVTTMLTYPWKALMLMTRHFDYCPSASEGENQSVRSSAPVVSRCFPGGYNVKLYISRGRLAWWLLAFLHSVNIYLHGPVHGVISLVPGHLVFQKEVSVVGCHILKLVLLAELELEEAKHSLLQVCAP